MNTENKRKASDAFDQVDEAESNNHVKDEQVEQIEEAVDDSLEHQDQVPAPAKKMRSASEELDIRFLVSSKVSHFVETLFRVLALNSIGVAFSGTLCMLSVSAHI